MKESELIQLKNKVKNLEGLVQALMGQGNRTRDISIGTLETLKRMDGYQKAVDQLKADLQTDSGKKKNEEDLVLNE